MKKFLGAAAVAGALFALTGCSAVVSKPIGAIYNDTTTPEMVTQNAGAAKEGTATCQSILGIVALGDCSVGAAAQNGGVRSIQSVDSKVWSILGLYTTYTTIVKGQ